MIRAVKRPTRIPTAKPPRGTVKMDTMPCTMLVALNANPAFSITLYVVMTLFKATATPSVESVEVR